MTVTGFDSYNLCLTGDIGRTLATPSGGLNEHIPVVCMAFDVYNMQGNNHVFKTLNNIATDSDHIPVICLNFQGNKSNCGYDENIMMTLCSDRHGTPHALCYAIEGNVVDRVNSQNGKGWCENVSPALNTQDKHAICFQLCGDRDNPSVSTSDKAYCIPANPMSDRGQAVCFQNTGHGWWNQGDIAQTLRTPCGGDSMKANIVMMKNDEE